MRVFHIRDLKWRNFFDMMNVPQEKEKWNALHTSLKEEQLLDTICKTIINLWNHGGRWRSFSKEDLFLQIINNIYFSNIKIMFKAIDLWLNTLKNFLGFLHNATYWRQMNNKWLATSMDWTISCTQTHQPSKLWWR